MLRKSGYQQVFSVDERRDRAYSAIRQDLCRPGVTWQTLVAIGFASRVTHVVGLEACTDASR